MRRRRLVALLTLMCALVSCSFATTCIWGKAFKTRKVCGVVRDFVGAEIPNAIVQVEKPETQNIIAESKTNAEGSFDVKNLAAGGYVIRIKVQGFADASQSFRLARLDKGNKCRQPIRVVMDVAGRCSLVENAWKK